MARQFPLSACFKRWSTTNNLSLFDNAPVRNINSSGLRYYRVKITTPQKSFQPSRVSNLSQHALRLQVQNLKNVFTPKSYLHTSRQLQLLGNMTKRLFNDKNNVGKMTDTLLKKFGPGFSYLFISGIVATSGVTYFLFLNTVPFTGRNRILLITPEDAVIVGRKVATEFEKKITKENKGKFSVDKDWVGVLNKILEANPSIEKHTKGRAWTVKVLKPNVKNAENDKNAKSFPDGSIYIYDGLLNFAKSDDQRAVILAHEMASVACLHAVEMASHKTFREWMSACEASNCKEVKVTEFATGVVFDHLLKVQDNDFHTLEVEKEANFVGLMFATKACYNPKAGINLYNNLAKDELENVSACLGDYRMDEDLKKNEELKSCDLIDMPDWSRKMFRYPERSKYLRELQPKANQWKREFCPDGEPLPKPSAKEQEDIGSEVDKQVKKLVNKLKGMKLPKNDPRINMELASGAIKSPTNFKS